MIENKIRESKTKQISKSCRLLSKSNHFRREEWRYSDGEILNFFKKEDEK